MKIYKVFQISFTGLIIFISGCYSYDPLPEGIDKNKYSGLNSR